MTTERCTQCFRRLMEHEHVWCDACDRKWMRNHHDYDDAPAPTQPAVTVAERTCEVCLQPSSFSPCERCERGDLGLLRHGDQPW